MLYGLHRSSIMPAYITQRCVQYKHGSAGELPTFYSTVMATLATRLHSLVQHYTLNQCSHLHKRACDLLLAILIMYNSIATQWLTTVPYIHKGEYLNLD